MLNYLDKLSTPEWIVLIVVSVCVLSEFTKGITVIWGVFAPKIFKISTKISRKKEIENIILNNQKQIQLLSQKHLEDMQESEDTDKHLKEEINKTNEKLDKISDLVLNMRIENMRKTLLDFASHIGSGRKCTKEQFDEMFVLYKDYEDLLKSYGMTNGRVDISMEIVREKYKYNVLHSEFLEDIIKNKDDVR